jgi:serine/threonine protein kinase
VHADVMPPLSGGRYQLFQVLGSGGMATVYRAYDRSLDIERAIKILAPHLVTRSVIRERFAVEARTMARLHHANIVAVHDVGSDGDRLFIVMEYLNGGEVHGRMEKCGLYPPKLATYVVKAMCSGLQVAHDKGVTHRDIKPHNVLISGEGIPKVTDFGIAQVSDTNSGLTRTGMVMGTLAYMAPEQRSGARNADNRSDIYACAATLFNLVTGDEPFDLFSSEVREDMLLKVGEPLSEIIRKGCAYKAENRYQSCTEMLEAIEAIEGDLPEVPEDHPPLAMPPTDTHETQVPTAPSGSGISVETFDSSLAVNTDAGVSRSASDPFGHYDPSTGQFRKSDPSNMDSGATFFEMDDEEVSISDTGGDRVVAPQVEPAPVKKSQPIILFALGAVAVMAALVGMFVLGQRDGSSEIEPAATVNKTIAILEASQKKRAATLEKETVEVLKKADAALKRAEKIAIDPTGADVASTRKDVEAVLEEQKDALQDQKEAVEEERETLLRVVEETPALQNKIDANLLDQLVDLDEEDVTVLVADLPESVKAMVQRQWEHEKRVAQLEETTAGLKEQYTRLEELALKADEATARLAAEKAAAPVPVAAPTAAPAPAAAPAPVIEEPPLVDANAPMGKVQLNAKPYAKYYIDGKEVKMARGQSLEVTVGKHEVIFQDATSSRRKKMTVVVNGSRLNRFCWNFDEERDFCK